MHAGYYTIASGMLTRQRELDVIGNNLVNVQTPGYRTDRLLISPFEQELLTRREANGEQVLAGTAATSAVVGGVVSLMNEGTIKPTDRALDMAISGDGFFNIQTEDGTALSRNGQFVIDAEGYLSLPGAGRVLGTNGPIRVENEHFTVETNGDIFGEQGNFIAALQITMPEEGAVLTKREDGLFLLAGGGAAPAAQGVSIYQNSVELSNVDMNQELTNLLEAQRAFQACSSALQIVDAMNRKAATQLAGV